MGLNYLLEPRWSALALAERAKRETEIVLSRRPIERNAVARAFLKPRAKGRDRLLEPRRSALALAERPKRETEIVLSHRPIERIVVARALLKRRAKGRVAVILLWQDSAVEQTQYSAAE